MRNFGKYGLVLVLSGLLVAIPRPSLGAAVHFWAGFDAITAIAPAGTRQPGRLGVLSPASENEDGHPDPPPRRVPIPALNLHLQSVPAQAHPGAQQILNAVAQALSQREINVALLGGSKYMVTDCLGLKASVGEFTMRLPNTAVRFEGGLIRAQAVIPNVTFNALRVRVRPNVGNPSKLCHFSPAFTVGGTASNVQLELLLDAKLNTDQCSVGMLSLTHVAFRIGVLSLRPLQNNLDEMTKDMVEEAMTVAAQTLLPAPIGAAINDAVCQSKVMVYRRYMEFLSSGVKLHQLPEYYATGLKPYYPHVDLGAVKFGFSTNQPPPPVNATTDCMNIYFNDPWYVSQLKQGIGVEQFEDFKWLLHELRHTEQCMELGGRDPYAERWFKDMEISVLLNLLNTNPKAGLTIMHNRMPMERDADARADHVCQVLGLSSLVCPAKP